MLSASKAARPRCTPTRASVAATCVRLAVILSAVSCFRDVAAPGALKPNFAAIPAGAVQPDIVVHALGSNRYRLSLLVRTSGQQVAAYQGALTFAPGLLSVDSHSVPPSDVHLVNDDAAAGVVRFAVFGVNGLRDSTAFELEVSAVRALQPDDLKATLDVVGTPEGGRVAKSRVAASRVALLPGDR